MKSNGCVLCKQCEWWHHTPYAYATKKATGKVVNGANKGDHSVTWHSIEGGICQNSGNNKKFLQGYFIPHLNFQSDCITFAIDKQTGSLYYTGPDFGCVHGREKLLVDDLNEMNEVLDESSKGEDK